MGSSYVSEADIQAFQQDGAVCIRGLFADWVDTIAAGIERNLENPSSHAAESESNYSAGSFFDDYCNWERIPEFENVIRNSGAAEAAAAIVRSSKVQLFHDHVLVKEPGTSKATPWHQDFPYYFVDGEQLVSFWIPVDPVKETTLRFIAGSHLWEKLVLPVRWLDDSNFYADADDYLPVPDPDAEPDTHRVLEWEMQPGDVAMFHFKTVHGARGNLSQTRRRAMSIRWIGDDGRYVPRPGPTSPPFPGHGMQAGERLREDWFPVIWSGEGSNATA